MPSQWKQKRKSIRHYDQTAPTYDSQYQEEQEAKITAAFENLRLDSNAVILDLGCGTGIFFSHVAENAKLIMGIDTSLAFLKQARAKTARNAHIIRADADHQPFKADTFSHTFAFTLIQNTPNPLETLEELKRTARLNATIVITGLKKHFTLENFTQLLRKTDLEILSLITDDTLKDYIAICQKHLNSL